MCWTTPRGLCAPRFGLPRLLRSGFSSPSLSLCNANPLKSWTPQHLFPSPPLLPHKLSNLHFVEPAQLVRIVIALTGSFQLRGKFSFPARNHHARDAIPENSHCSSAHIHELIDREKKKQRLHRQVKRSCRAEYNQQRSARHARRSLAADQQRENHQNLLADTGVKSRGLHHKK